MSRRRVPVEGRSGTMKVCGVSAGFTLIELLVAMAIVAILIALLMAVSKPVLESAKAAKCVSNMRQVGVAFQSYVQNNNSMLPQRYYGIVNGQRWGYTDVLLTYCDNDGRIFKCPSQPRNDYPDQPSYGMNWYFDNVSINAVATPSRTIMLAETLGPSGTGSRRADRDSGTPGQLDSLRHGNKANYLFFDGHIERLAWNNTVAPVDMWGNDSGNHTPTLR